MIDFKVLNIGYYDKPEKYCQTINGTWLAFYVSGLLWNKTYWHDGRLLREHKRGKPPSFELRLPGMTTDFEFGKDRENWVIMLDNFPMRYSKDTGFMEIQDEHSWIRVPCEIPVPEAMVSYWQSEIKKLRAILLKPLPVNRLRCKLGVMNILRHIIEYSHNESNPSPAEKLQKMLDKNHDYSYSITEMSRECSYTPDHLRELFKQQFGITPQEYRHKRRMNQAMDLLANTDLSVKEVSGHLGFRHVSHFCKSFKKIFGMTPKEGIKRFRYSIKED
jgi:AraC-like DNA-binding protein